MKKNKGNTLKQNRSFEVSYQKHPGREWWHRLLILTLRRLRRNSFKDSLGYIERPC
jgi:hypothetical protein